MPEASVAGFSGALQLIINVPTKNKNKKVFDSFVIIDGC